MCRAARGAVGTSWRPGMMGLLARADDGAAGSQPERGAPYGMYPPRNPVPWAHHAEAVMAYASDKGGARPVSSTDFNDRVKRLLAEKPETQVMAKDRKDKRSFARSAPRP